jgi:hypothetical protein
MFLRENRFTIFFPSFPLKNLQSNQATAQRNFKKEKSIKPKKKPEEKLFYCSARNSF